VQWILRLAKCDRIITHYLGNNERTDNQNLLSFGVSYDFVARKWRILAIFHTKKSIFGKLLRWYWALKAKILN